MPGGKLATVRIGDESELLANYILEHFAFVTRVPREEDVGIDFLCSLIVSKAKMIEAGPSFAVQIKSNEKPIVYSKPYARNWLSNQDNPLFIGVVNCDKGVLELFSTWRMLNAFLYFTPPRVRLMIGSPRKGDYIHYTKSKARVDIYLGDPVVSISITDVRDSALVAERTKVIREWISLDRLNNVRRIAKLFWVLGPRNYSTNSSILESPMEYRFFENPKNINFTKHNFVLACIGVLRDLRRQPNLSEDYADLHNQLEDLLVHSSGSFTDFERQLLKDIGQLPIE